MFRVEMFAMPVSSTPTPLDKLLCACFSTFHMRLSFVNKIKVIFKNSQVPVDALHHLFHHLTPGDVEIRETQIAPPRQCLDFLPEPDPEATWAAGAGEQQVQQWGVSEGGSGLVEDVALGIRLYKAYMSGLGNGKG